MWVLVLCLLCCRYVQFTQKKQINDHRVSTVHTPRLDTSVDVTIWTVHFGSSFMCHRKDTHKRDSRQDMLTCPEDRSRTPAPLWAFRELAERMGAHAVGADFPPSKRHGNTLYHVFPRGCIPMLCQMEESGDSLGCTSLLFFQNEGWIVHEGLQTGQGAPGNQVH